MQPQEIDNVLAGADIKDEIINRRMAYFCTWLIAPHVKRGKVSMDKLLDPLKKKQKPPTEKLREEKALLEKALKNGKK